MAIKREYKTKEECVDFYINECFDSFPSWVVTDQPNFFEEWDFQGRLDEEEAEEQESEYGYVNVPMWNTWFIPNDSFLIRFIEQNPEKVMDCGFTLIYDKDGDLFALGIDSMGYSFKEAHFTPLYDAEGLHWHDEPEEEQES